MWGCRDQATKAQGNNFETDEQTVGSTRVRPTTDTTYTVSCITPDSDVQTESSCTVDVVKPAIALLSTPQKVSRGGTVVLSWKTVDISSCVLTSSEHSNFSREGISGDAVSPTLTRGTTFVLTCETLTGVIEERTLGVEVLN